MPPEDSALALGARYGQCLAVVDDVYARTITRPARLVSRPQLRWPIQLFRPTDGSKLGTSFGYAHPVEDGRRGTSPRSTLSLSTAALPR